MSTSNASPRVFVSHANADGEYVTKFVEGILIRGAGLRSDDVFYSSAADMGVKSGEHLMERVRTEAGDSALVIALVTPMYQTRPVCVAELGAAWARDVLFPVLAPGMDRSDLEGVLPGLMIKPADDETVLDELADQIRKLGFEFEATSFGAGKATWQSDLRRGVAPALLELSPNADDLRRLQQDLANTQVALDEAKADLEKERERNDRLSAAKTATEVREANLPSNENERFEALRGDVKEAFRPLTRVVADAVWHDIAEQEMHRPERFERPDEYEAINDEMKAGRLNVDDETGEVSPDTSFPAVERARDTALELMHYLDPRERSEAFFEWFRNEYQTPMDLTKKACWDAVI
ncbi:toll/interleukin-1 receptor domain-containing protein [Dietzia sp. NPDC055343]